MEDGDDPRDLWLQRKRAAETDMIRGATQLVMSVPILVVGGFLAYAIGGQYSILIALIMLALTLASIGRGTMRILHGTRNKRRATVEIAGLDRGRLPEARVIERG